MVESTDPELLEGLMFQVHPMALSRKWQSKAMDSAVALMVQTKAVRKKLNYYFGL